MKETIIAIFIMFCAVIFTSAQITEVEKQLITQGEDTLKGWDRGGAFNINASQTSLTNWSSGGQNSVSLNGIASLYAHYSEGKGLWENFLDLGYGSLKQDKNDGWWKTDDKLSLVSKYGYNIKDKWYFAALMNFKTQFAPGYNYPNDSVLISGFLAPAYLLGGIGFDYIPNENFTIFIAPLTYKLTVVNDKALSDEGAFGVKPGNSSYSELGGYIRTSAKVNLMENIVLNSKLDLFSNYLNKPQNIDVNWETLINMKVNRIITVSLSTHLIYDDDTLIAIDDDDDGITDKKGPRVQFKEVLAVGLSLIF